MPTAARPDYSLGIMDKTNGRRGNVGVGWDNDDGSINISLNPGVCLEYNPDLTLRLFPVATIQTKGKKQEDNEEYPYEKELTMNELTEQDMYWIAKRIPKNVWNLLKNNPKKLFLAGGFIRSCIANEPVNDIDLFHGGSKEEIKALAEGLKMAMYQGNLHTTDNAFTVLSARSVPVQFIFRWIFDNPIDCVKSFDFTVARAAIWFDEKEPKGMKDSEGKPLVELRSYCDERFYPDLAAKRLVYCQPVRNEEAGGSILRVLKFYQKGYRIPLDSLGAVVARLMMGVEMDKIPLSAEYRGISNEEMLGRVVTGLLREVDPMISDEKLAYLPYHKEDV